MANNNSLLDTSYLNLNSFTPIGDLGSGLSSNTAPAFDLGINTSFGNTGLPQEKPSFLAGQGGKNVAAGIQGLGSLASALAAYKQYKLGKETLNYNKAAFNRNLENTTSTLNSQIQDRALSRAHGDARLQGDFDRIQQAADTEYEQRRLNGSPLNV